MSTYNLKSNLIAETHSDSFGTQYIEYYFTTKSGAVLKAYSSHDEGDWLDSKESMIREFKNLKKFDHGKIDPIVRRLRHY